MTDIPYGDPGIASFATEAFRGRDFLLSDEPTLITESFSTPANGTNSAVEYDFLEVVDISDAGVIAKATTVAIPASHFRGVMAHKASIAASASADTDRRIQVYISGNFNGDALGWPAAIATDAQQIGAFRGADTPVQILIGFNKYDR